MGLLIFDFFFFLKIKDHHNCFYKPARGLQLRELWHKGNRYNLFLLLASFCLKLYLFKFTCFNQS